MDEKDQSRMLEAKLADLRARLPAHSLSPRMLMELEDLEEEIARLRPRLHEKGEGDVQADS